MLTQIPFPAGIELPPMANLHPNKTKKQNNCALYGQVIYKTDTASTESTYSRNFRKSSQKQI